MIPFDHASNEDEELRSIFVESFTVSKARAIFVAYLALSVLAPMLKVGDLSYRIIRSFIMAFAALGVLCYGLSCPFLGFYKVEDVSQ